MFGRRGNDGFSRRIVPGVPAQPAPQPFAVPQPAPHAVPAQNGTPLAPIVSPSGFSRRIARPANGTPAAVPAAPAQPAATDIDALLPATDSHKPAEVAPRRVGVSTQDTVLAAKSKVQPALLERIDVGAASKLPRAELE